MRNDADRTKFTAIATRLSGVPVAVWVYTLPYLATAPCKTDATLRLVFLYNLSNS